MICIRGCSKQVIDLWLLMLQGLFLLSVNNKTWNMLEKCRSFYLCLGDPVVLSVIIMCML